MQTQIPPELELSAVTKRHAVEDVLIAKEKGTDINAIKENGIVATGSLRRRSQLLHLRPDIKIVELRGNVQTRIKKFLDSDWDAIILARAGIERLGLKKYISSVISREEFLPAVGQGALGIEISAENRLVDEILRSINHEETFIAIAAERELLKKLEGGCQVPIGAYAEVTPNGLYLDGFVGAIDGSVTFRGKMRGSKLAPEKLGGKLAENLITAGAKDILDEIYKNQRQK